MRSIKRVDFWEVWEYDPSFWKWKQLERKEGEKKLLPKYVSQNFQRQQRKTRKVVNSFPAERRGLLGDRNEMKLKGAGTDLALGNRLVHF